jgi:hypothetical protein
MFKQNKIFLNQKKIQTNKIFGKTDIINNIKFFDKIKINN